ncbi:SIS domain-containing protein [Candidatus Enterococcus willemsii]|uniref:Glucosamine-fructose-6-phosphate aminotransferase n=1 Tax=Candidatus Enterococcus willemsii TaxID=1857215 RepID=A0ABQ6YVB0_9ENTE|nr:SIS domain-containing protein [Enterococcus sp. CU12B]KAF1301037.1 glucosamine-fructose-6-phosphate aminotransferase [Enterococcus sp. CU12B]
MKTMLDYIQEEPETLQAILDNYQFKQDEKFEKLTHLLILATGSSYNACLSAKVFFEKVSGITVSIEEPYHFNHYGKITAETNGILAVSQSGKSASTIDAMQHTKKDLVRLALTSNLDSPIAEGVDEVIDLGIGIETVGFVTKGYTATVLHLMLLGLTIGLNKKQVTETDVSNYKKQLQQLITAIPSIITNSQVFFEKQKDSFQLSTRFIAIGYGANWGTAKEFETKFTETVRQPSSGFELEAYMHGPYLEADAEHTLFFIENESPQAERSLQLRAYMQDYVGKTFTITTATSHEADMLGLNIRCDEDLTPLIQIIPFQLFAYQTATFKGIDLSKRIFDDFDTVLKSKR